MRKGRCISYARESSTEIISYCDENGIEPYFVTLFSKEACFAHSSLAQDQELQKVLENELAAYNELESLFDEQHIRRHCFLNEFSGSPDTLDGHPNPTGAGMIANPLITHLGPLLQEVDSNNYPFA